MSWAFAGRQPEELVEAILDPNRQVDPRYLLYIVSTTDGRSLGGAVTAETATSLTLRRADGGTDVVLRSEITSLETSGMSLMQEGLENLISPAAMSDLIAYLRAKGH